MAMPQYAMAQEGSCAARAVQAFTVSGKKNECSMATARLNCVCAAALQEMGKLTRPNFSSCASAAGCASNSKVGRTNRTGVPRNWGMALLLDRFDHTLVPDSEVRIILRHARLRTSESKGTSNLLI